MKKKLAGLLGDGGLFEGASKHAVYARMTGRFWENVENTKQHSMIETTERCEQAMYTPTRAVFPQGFRPRMNELAFCRCLTQVTT